MPKLVIGKTYSFAAAHHLPEHDGKCRRPHGHNYRVEVEVGGPVQQSGGSSRGMVLDFADLDSALDLLIDLIDHTDLNENPWMVEFLPPTAENIVGWFVDRLDGAHKRVVLERVRVWETDKCYAEWRRD